MVFHLSEALGRIKRNLAELLGRETILEALPRGWPYLAGSASSIQ
ncbi:MAG: hypothetical protein U1D30_22840 [Planctomycetota bacterium]